MMGHLTVVNEFNNYFLAIAENIDGVEGSSSETLTRQSRPFDEKIEVMCMFFGSVSLEKWGDVVKYLKNDKNIGFYGFNYFFTTTILLEFVDVFLITVNLSLFTVFFPMNQGSSRYPFA